MPPRSGYARKEPQEVMNHDREIVSAVHRVLADQVGAERHELWFGDSAQLEVQDGTLLVSAPHPFLLDVLRRNFQGDLQGAARSVLGTDASVVFRVQTPSSAPTGSAEADAEAVSGQADAGPGCDNNGIAARGAPVQEVAVTGSATRGAATRLHTPSAATTKGHAGRAFARLETFVAGDDNRVAYTAVDMIIRCPGSVSPLFIYGPPGVGKTHLLESVWSSLRGRSRARRVILLSAEQFTSYFLEALQGSGLPNFRRKYRDCDVLIIDNVHFFSGKRATGFELLHTLDGLLRDGRQLVFAADRPPAQLSGLGPELVTRLSGGLICGIQPLDEQTRRGVLQRLAAQRQLQLPPDVLPFIAAHAGGDARQLAGALNRLQAVAQAFGRPISLELAQESLSDLLPGGSCQVGLSDIERAVCHTFGLEPKSLQSDRKVRQVSHPRMLAMWLARKYTPAAMSEISQYFGRRSHSSVALAQGKVERWLAEGRSLHLTGRAQSVRDVVRQLEQTLRAG